MSSRQARFTQNINNPILKTINASTGLMEFPTSTERHLDTQLFGDDGGTATKVAVNSSGHLLVDIEPDPSSSTLMKANDGNDGAGTDRTVKCDSNGVLEVSGTVTTSISDVVIKGNDGADGSGTDRTILTDGNGAIVVDASKEGLVSANGTTEALHTMMLATNDGTNLRTVACDANGVLSVDGSASTQPISAASLPLPAGASTSAKQPALGTAGTASADVLSVQGVASMTPLVVDGSASTQPVSGTVTANAGTGTFAVSAASLPLPAGAATAAKQPALGTAGTASADVLSVQGVASMTALVVDGSASTQPISAASLPLPAGAATEATLSNAEGHLGTIDTSTAGIVASHYADGDAVGGTDTGVLVMGRNGSNTAKPIHITSNGDVEVEIADFVKGQATKANSFPVVIASDQDTLAVEETYTYSSEFTIINAETIADGNNFQSSAFQLSSIREQPIISFTISSGGSTSYTLSIEGSIDGSNFFDYGLETSYFGDTISSTESFGIVPVEYLKFTIANNHGSGSHVFSVKATSLGATLGTP